ncbi:FRG domain-containing protein [Butyrivibrio sp. WCD3002]|uniref:FRG domain-containing protein n=1 Tax=Butyrivibrio sp. WCD3002 TaxID=1280676 RepID=UPI0003F53AF9|nr:FRG domain-containing protein [Butyrivibrio sp. WCD3002]
MIKTVEISDMNSLFDMVSEQEYREDLDRHRNLFVYRGQPDAEFPLTTSLMRNCKDKRRELEPCMLRNFTKYAALEEPTIERSVWRQMIFGQHHGLPTRLLDWSFSPLMALHFSVTENDMDEMEAHDSAVWRTDIHELHDLLPEKYQKIAAKYATTVFSVDMLAEICSSLEQYDEDMGSDSILMIEPPSVDVRIVNQYSFFAVIPSAMEDIQGFLDKNTEKTVKYIIKKELRWQIRDMLDHQNISERIVYPGLDGLSRWLGRHYFVK